MGRQWMIPGEDDDIGGANDKEEVIVVTERVNDDANGSVDASDTTIAPNAPISDAATKDGANNAVGVDAVVG